jgi:hypothetical protein
VTPAEELPCREQWQAQAEWPASALIQVPIQVRREADGLA